MHAPAPPPPDAPSPPNRDGLVALAVATLVLITVVIGTLAPSPPGRSAHASPADDTTCAEWSDGCTICQRHADGPACSLPGIACVREAPRCLRHAGG